MTALEQASERQGVSTDTLMENAGLRVAEAARRLMGGAAGKRVLVLVGPGNNGADGLVTARHLRRWGADVVAYVVTRRPDADPKMDLAVEYDVTINGASGDADLRALDRTVARCDLIIDAVLGTGRSRPLTGPIKDVVSRLRPSAASGPPILAMDLPTGLNPDTGEVDPAGITADVTVTLGRPKVGLLTFPGAAFAGRLEVADIGLPPELELERSIDLEMLTGGWVKDRLPDRPFNSHKGTFGHALVIAGSRNYVGAACLAAQGAVRTGAGLATLAAPQSIHPIAAGKLTEVIHLPLPDDDEGRMHPDGAALVHSVYERYDSLLIGCGMGLSSGTTAFLESLLVTGPLNYKPTVIDADGLNNLARIPNWWKHLTGPVVLTPHPGEMATLTGTTIAEVQKNRVDCARRWASHWGASVALKGALTVIAEPGGMARISPFANPGLASGGTGDVLTGVIAGLMAQGLSPFDAACCGVYVHGLAAETVVRKYGNTGILASDLVEQLPSTIHSLR
jgi:NAD(P)H-hydrate epimerase